MTQNNLQKSELVISKVLEHLLDMGLQLGTMLHFEDLELSEEYGPTYDGCCRWLLDEGLIRCGNLSQTLDGHVTMASPMITSQGFAVLDQPFYGTDGQTRVGQAVKEVAGGQKNFAGIGDLVGGILGGFTKSLGSG